jgi:hypothetical protein
MRDKIEVGEPGIVPEVQEGNKVRFEPGIHPHEVGPIKIGEKGEAIERLSEGDLTAHRWNSEVAERLMKYKPAGLVIDGLTPIDYVDPDILEKHGIGDSLRREVWIKLPGNPREINGTGELIVGLGDFVEGPKGFTVEMGEDSELQQKELTVEASAVALASVTALVGSVILGRKKRIDIEVNEKYSGNISRRKFLGLMGKGVGTLGIAYLATQLSSIYFAGRTSNGTSEFWQGVANIVKPRFADMSWLNARTALMIAKANDLQRNFGEYGVGADETCAVVAGSFHTYNSDNFLSSKEARRKEILSFAEKIMEAVRDVYCSEKNSPVKVTRESWDLDKRLLVENLARMDVVRVRDPELEKTDNHLKVLRKNIDYLGTINSREVKEALEPLGNMPHEEK